MDPATAIDLTPIIEPVLQMAGVLLAGVLMWAAKRGADYFKVQLTADHRAVLQDAIDRGVSFGIGKAKQQLSSVQIDVKNEAAAAAVNYVLARTPDALDHFGVTRESLVEMVMSRLEDREEQGALPLLTSTGAARPTFGAIGTGVPLNPQPVTTSP